MDATFAALMSKAKANTQQLSGVALARQAELEAQRKREAEIEKQNAAREKERRLKELEARQRREQERLELEERLRQEREKKRAQKLEEDLQSKASAATKKKGGSAAGGGGAGKLPSTTERIPSASKTASTTTSSVLLKKKRRIDAMFSDDEGSSDASSSRRAGSSKHSRLNGLKGKSSSSNLHSSSSDNLSAKEKLKLEFDPSALRSLNENKKDVRTIEEIEQDLRRKHALAQPASTAPTSTGLFASRKTASASTPSSQASTSAAPLHSQTSSSKSTTIDTATASNTDKQSKLADISSVKGKGRASSEETTKRKRTLSPADAKVRTQASRRASPPPSSSSLPRKHQRDASPPSSPENGKLSKAEARRREIWAILNPHKAHLANYGASYDNDDDFSDEDMEAGIDDIEEEDRRAARIARMEDKAEEERLKQKAREKAARKSGK